MKANVYHAPKDVRVETVPDPSIVNSGDAIMKITKSAICGSDLHFYRGNIPMDDGFIVGHEFMGIIEDVGKDCKLFKTGDKVVAPFWAGCGICHNCKNEYPTACTGGGGCFGYGEAFGGYGGGQAEYVRIPFADSTLEKVPEEIEDEKILFLGDILSTAYFCAERGKIKPGDVVIVWGDGPLGLLTTLSAKLFSPSIIITIGHHDYRLSLAKKMGCDIAINSKNEDPIERIQQITKGHLADVALECIGLPTALQNSFKMVKPGGTISFIGLFAEDVSFPMLDFFLKDLTVTGGVCPAKNYISKLLPLITSGKIDPSLIISHDLPLSETPRGYELMDNKNEDAVKVVLTP
ncbi:MAG: zinc-binding dehydrogenase [Thermodesulfobacteriota bacterium]